MKRLTALFALLLSQASFALGPLDEEATIQWWDTELSGNLFDADLKTGTINLNAQGWWGQRWGIQGGINLSDTNSDQFQDPRRINFDLNRRLFSPTDNTYISAGLGWGKIQLASGDNTHGIRLSLRGQIGFAGFASLYGQSTWLPTLDSTNDFSNISGSEFETGVVFEPLPYISLKAGYRRFKLDYDFSGSAGTATSSGFILGTGIHW